MPEKHVQMTKNTYIDKLIVSQVFQFLYTWQYVCTYLTWYKVFGIVSSLSAWLNGTVLMR